MGGAVGAFEYRYLQKGALDTLELELQVAVSCLTMTAGDLGPLHKQGSP